MELARVFPLLCSHYQVIILLFSFVMTVAFSIRAYQKRGRPVTLAFFWLMLSLALWLAGSIMEHTRPVLADRVFWIKFQYLGITTLPVFWLLFTLRYTEKQTSWLGARKFLLFLIPVITVAMALTNESHNLVWKDLLGDISATQDGLRMQYGLWFWLHTVYCYGLLVIGNFILFLHYIRNTGLNRRRAGVMLLASFIPWVINIIFVLGDGFGFTIDPTPVAFVVTALVILWGLSRANLLDFMPVAYEAIFRNIHDGVIVLDEKNRVRDINRAAEQILKVGRSGALDKKLNNLILPGSIIKENITEYVSPRRVLVTGDNHARRYYDVSVTHITGKHSVNGRLLILHDDTTRREAEQHTAEKARLEAELKARREMQEVLTESAERLKALSEDSPVMICNFDLLNKITYVNKKFESVTGYNREEILGKHIYDRETFDDMTLQTIKERLQVKMSGVNTKPIEVSFICKNKTAIWLSLVAEPIREQNNIVGFQVIGQDVTERRKMEDKLRKAEEHYRTIFESANDVILITDDKCNVIDVNRKVNKICGLKRESLIGRNFKELTDIMPESSLEIIRSQYDGRPGKEDLPPFEIEMFRENGETVNIEANGVLLQDGDKNIGRLLTLRDITERRKSERIVKFQRELIDQMIATIPSAVAIVGKDMRLLLANNTFHRLFNTTESDIRNKALSETVPVKELEAALYRLMKTDIRETSLEFRAVVGEKPRIFTAGIVKMQNERLLVFMNDITEEREKQERFYLTDRLASIGEIASGVAHELNNPLTSIIGLSSMLSEKDFDSDTKEDLKAISSEAERCAIIVRNLLTFARKHTAKRQPVQVTKILEDVLKLRNYELSAQNIKVETEFDPDLPEVMVDYFQIQQVFLNIILNAESAMLEAHGSGTLKITGSRKDGHVDVSFADDGPGVAPENVNNLFTPFFTTKEVGKGTGLGLSISYGIVSSHGGKIYLGESGGKGANFVIELPVSAG